MQQEFREVEFRYGFSFPWFMIPSYLQDAIDDVEQSIESQDMMDDCHIQYLGALLHSGAGEYGWRIAREIAERYDLDVPMQLYGI